jgi:hypothetical protein
VTLGGTRGPLVVVLALAGCAIPPGAPWQGAPPDGAREPSDEERAIMAAVVSAWSARDDLPEPARLCETPPLVYVAANFSEAWIRCGRRRETIPVACRAGADHPDQCRWSCYRRSGRRTRWIVTHVDRPSPRPALVHESVHWMADCTRGYDTGESLRQCYEARAEMRARLMSAGYSDDQATGEAWSAYPCTHTDPRIWDCRDMVGYDPPGCAASVSATAREESGL